MDTQREMPELPEPRGPLSAHLLSALREAPHTLAPIDVAEPQDVLADEDLQLALYCCYELHYRGLPGVDERWEWEPSLLGFRARLEAPFEAAVVAAVGPVDVAGMTPETTDLALRAVTEADEGPSVSRYFLKEGTREQLLEYLVHRSLNQLKEADTHSWVIPRLSGPPKAALVEIQADEYGAGRPERLHAQLFANTMDAVGLDSTYGAYLDLVPGSTLATVNLTSLFGLHRRRRGAVVGHLALYEMTSAVPSGRMVAAMRRLGIDDPAALDFYEEHVAADSVHEAIAAVDLAGGLVRAEPHLAADVIFGARALTVVDARAGRQQLDAWAAGRSSLRADLPLAVPA